MATPPEVDQDQNLYVNFQNEPYVTIPQFYVGRSVFITGGTGFMGKVHSICFPFIILSNFKVHFVSFFRPLYFQSGVS